MFASWSGLSAVAANAKAEATNTTITVANKNVYPLLSLFMTMQILIV
jgi:hypothetical protein